MKLSVSQLRRIIKEEVTRMLRENEGAPEETAKTLTQVEVEQDPTGTNARNYRITTSFGRGQVEQFDLYEVNSGEQILRYLVRTKGYKVTPATKIEIDFRRHDAAGTRTKAFEESFKDALDFEMELEKDRREREEKFQALLNRPL